MTVGLSGSVQGPQVIAASRKSAGRHGGQYRSLRSRWATAVNVKPTAGAASIALLLLLAGCGGPRPQLLDATQQALAAVRSDQLTFRLLDQRRLPAATADVVLQDMTDELTAAEKATAQVAASSDIDRRDRDDVLKAIRAAVSAALSSEYCLDRAAVCTRAGQELASVAEQLDALVASLETGR